MSTETTETPSTAPAAFELAVGKLRILAGERGVAADHPVIAPLQAQAVLTMLEDLAADVERLTAETALQDGDRAVLAGLLAPSSEEVNADGIYAEDEGWDRLRAAFPLELWRAWVAQHGDPDDVHEGTEEGIGYNPEAGW